MASGLSQRNEPSELIAEIILTDLHQGEELGVVQEVERYLLLFGYGPGMVKPHLERDSWELTHRPSTGNGTLLAWERRASSVACTEMAWLARSAAGVSAFADELKAACGGAECVTGSITASDTGAGTSTKRNQTFALFLTFQKE